MPVRDRIRVAIGGALVLAVAAALSTALVVHSAQANPSTAAADTVPGDLAWALFGDCSARSPGALGSILIGIENDRMHVEPVLDDGTYNSDPAAVSAANALNACLAEYRIARDDDWSGSTPWFGNRADRLLDYDYTTRWMIPCLRGHGITIHAPVLSLYLSATSAPWADYYATSDGSISFADLLAARRACGSGGELAPDAPPTL